MPSRYLFALKNYRAALIAALFFGCIAPGSKFLIKDFPPQSLAGLLYIFARIGLFVILLFQKNIIISFSRIQKTDLKWFFWLYKRFYLE